MVAVVLGTPGTSSAITRGAADNGHGYVAEILVPGNARPSCTGVLVGSRLVLTAAHCLFHNGRRTGVGVRVSFDATFGSGSTTIAGAFYVSPSYDPSRSPEHDLAAIVLVSAPAIAPAQLASVGASSGYVGDVVTVGTGEPTEGVRRQATETVVSRSGQWLNLVPHSGNSCDGDSGGPDLLPGTDQVLALTDQGTCESDRDQRVDMVEAHTFVAAAPQWPTHAPLVHARLSSARVHRFATVTMTVRVSPLYAGDTLTRQVLVRGTWLTADRTTTTIDGLATFRLTPRQRGSVRTRVLLPAVATHPSSLSAELRLTVR